MKLAPHPGDGLAALLFLVAVVCGALLLAGCAGGPPPRLEVREVLVPVQAAPCVPADLAGPGAYADAGLRPTTPPDERYLAIAQANEQRKARLARVEPVIAVCR